MNTQLKKIRSDITTIKNSVEFISDSNCIFVLKHLLIVLEDIVKILDKSKTKINTCKYCKVNKTGSNDPDVLCPECREIFGHSFYSEL